MQTKVTIHSTGTGTCSLTGKESTDGLTVSFEDGTIKESFLSWKAFRQLLAMKAISPQEALTHPLRNQIYRCLGGDAALVVDAFTVDLRLSDTLLLCSDGVWGPVGDRGIEAILRARAAAPLKALGLIEAANIAGGLNAKTAITGAGTASANFQVGSDASQTIAVGQFGERNLDGIELLVAERHAFAGGRPGALEAQQNGAAVDRIAAMALLGTPNGEAP